MALTVTVPVALPLVMVTVAGGVNEADGLVRWMVNVEELVLTVTL